MKTAKYALGLLALAAAYLGAAEVGLAVPMGDANVSPVWPPAGVALVVLVLYGARFAPGIWLGAFFAAQLAGFPPLIGAAFGVGSTLGAVAGAALLRRVLGFDERLRRVRDVLALVGAASVSASLAAVIGIGSLLVSGFATWSGVVPNLGVFWVGDAVAMLIIAPLLLTLRDPAPAPRRALAETLALVATLAVVVLLVFGVRVDAATPHAQAFLVFPCAIWAALRFGPRGAALSAASISAVAIWGTCSHRGPFAVGVPVSGVLVLQLFMGTVCLTALLLAAASAERASAAAQVDLLAAAVRASTEAVLITDAEPAPDGPRILFANEAFTRLTGYASAEVHGKSPRVLHGATGGAERLARFEAALESAATFHAEMVYVRRDGRDVEVDVQLSPVPGDAGRAAHFVLTLRDMTERNRIRAQLALAERMATLGTLAAGVGHEINTPLAFIIANLEGLAQRLTALLPSSGASDPVHRSVRESLEGAERIRVIVRDLKKLSRDESTSGVDADLDELLRHALAVAAPEIPQGTRVVEELRGPPRVRLDEGRIGQVFLNLLVNAGQALVGAKEREIHVRSGETPDGRAFAEIRDSGPGIAADVLPHVFEPFFTTKADAGGTGLGLSICHQIVTACGGEIVLENAADRGTVARVIFPVAPAGAEPPPAREKAAASAERARILVVDDEIRFARSLRWLLEPQHEVTVTEHGDEALAWILGGRSFDVILCDLQMPRVSGMDIHAKLLAAAPAEAAKIIFISGGAITQAARDFLGAVPNKVLEKPVTAEVLTSEVARALRERAVTRGAA